MVSMLGAVGANVYNDFVNSNDRAQAQRLRTMQQFKEMLNMAPGMDAKGVFATYQNVTAGMDQWVKDAFTSDFLSSVAGQQDQQRQQMELQNLTQKLDFSRKMKESFEGMYDDAYMQSGGDADKMLQSLAPQIQQFAKYKEASPFLSGFGISTGPDGKIQMDQEKAKKTFDNLRADTETRIYSRIKAKMGDDLDWGYVERNYGSIAQGPLGQSIKAKMADDLVNNMAKTPWMYSSMEAVQGKLAQHGIDFIPPSAAPMVRYGQTQMQQQSLQNSAAANTIEASKLDQRFKLLQIQQSHDKEVARATMFVDDPAAKLAIANKVSSTYQSLLPNAGALTQQDVADATTGLLSELKADSAAKLSQNISAIRTKLLEQAKTDFDVGPSKMLAENTKLGESIYAKNQSNVWAQNVFGTLSSNLILKPDGTNGAADYVQFAKDIGTSDPAIFQQKMNEKLRAANMTVVSPNDWMTQRAAKLESAANLPSLDAVEAIYTNPNKLALGADAIAARAGSVLNQLRTKQISAADAFQALSEMDTSMRGQRALYTAAQGNPRAVAAMDVTLRKADTNLRDLSAEIKKLAPQSQATMAQPGAMSEAYGQAMRSVLMNIADDGGRPRNADYFAEMAARQFGVDKKTLIDLLKQNGSIR